ncbi:MAG TPA: NmrA family NAD(P)-binding protein [Polyangiaceae bacterium]|nr:NmrA family NAD(P)-binding protein [Polyangiaceae bacterium]
MTKPRILVTAAAGKTGAATALQLLAKGYPVRALVRRADARSESLRRAGAEVFVGSLEDIVDLRAALRDVTRAYFCPPLEPGTLRRATLFAAVAHEAKLEVVVALSQWLADPLHPAVHAREKWLSEQVFAWATGFDVVRINPGWFADNYLAALEPSAQFGLMALPLGDGLNAPPSNEDIARVIVAVLVDPRPHVGKIYRPTGPRLLDPPAIAATFGKVLGRRVKYQDAPLYLFLKVARSLGLSDFVISQLCSFLEDYRRNSFGVGAPTGVVRALTGSDPEDFELIVRRSIAASPLTQRTWTAKWRAVLQLARALVTPLPRVDRIEKQLGNPQLTHAALAADSPTWRQSHGVWT